MSTWPIEASSRVHDVIERAAGLRGDRPTLIDSRYSLGGIEAEAAMREAAASLAAAGVRAGDRVMIVGENSVAMAVQILALSRLGAWAVPVNARLTESEISRIARHCRPRTVLFTVEASAEAGAHARAAGAGPLPVAPGGLVWAAPFAAVDPEPVAELARDAVAAMIYTSGTTGQPKGVMLTHANQLFMAQTSIEVRGIGPEDRYYGIAPLSHSMGLAVVLAMLGGGAAVRFTDRFDPVTTATTLAKDGVSILAGAPSMYARLLELAATRDGMLPAPRLRYLSNGGAPLDAMLKARIEALWGLPLHNGYGLTEAAPALAFTRRERPATDDSVGPFIQGVEGKIVDPSTGNALATGEIGELWARGPNIMKGYYRDPVATVAVLDADGWLRTGDLARISAAGDLYIVGRLKELIIRSGFNVYPPEVEAAIATHPDVAMVAVVGRAVPGNEEVVAFVQPAAGKTLEPAALDRHVETLLVAYMRPQRWIVTDQLPVSPMGKILKAELAARARQLDGDAEPNRAETLRAQKDPATFAGA